MAFSSAHTGTTGSMTLTPSTDELASTVSLTDWTLNIVRDVVDATGFNPSSNWRTTLPGLSGGSGSFSGYVDDTTPLSMANTFEDTTTTVEAILTTASTGIVYTCNVWLTGFDTTAPVGGVVSCSGTFTVNGTITAV